MDASNNQFRSQILSAYSVPNHAISRIVACTRDLRAVTTSTGAALLFPLSYIPFLVSSISRRNQAKKIMQEHQLCFEEQHLLLQG
jgi:hypothetical protein